MKINPFFTCLNYHGIYTGTTGSVIGAYDFSSGSGSSIIYNLLYSTGQNFTGNNYYGPALPLVNVGLSGGRSGNLTGLGAFRLGYDVSGDFGLLLDITYDNCSRFINNRGNVTPNSIMSGGTLGTTTLPTYWQAVYPTGIFVKYSGSGIEDGYQYLDVRISGTALNAANIGIYPEGTTLVPAHSGQSWATSIDIKSISGTGITLFRFLAERNSAGILLQNSVGSSVSFSGSGAAYTSLVGSRVFTDSGTRIISAMIFSPQYASGQSVDQVIRIRKNSLRLTNWKEDYIPTSGTGVYPTILTTGSGYAYTLLSNTSGAQTGFLLGIDETNQLYISSSGYYKTLFHELGQRNLAYLNLGNQNTLEFGVFDPLTNKLTSESVDLPVIQNQFNTLYLGGLLNYNEVSKTTGFHGRLNHAILFKKPINFNQASGCFDCLFANASGTGIPQVTTLIVPSITGYSFVGTNESYITGYIPITGQVSTASGSIINLIFPSGLTGTRQLEEVATILTGTTTITITGEPTWIFPKSNEYNSFMTYDIAFINSLVSGDTVEIYTYSGFNSNVNLNIQDLKYPINTSYVQLIGNGLTETLGVDYTVENNNIISGFFESDSLTYDSLTGANIISPFSGWWARGKTLMSGGSYYPTEAQFNETTDTGRIIITGITGQSIPRYYDLYLNGQKLISGVHYKTIDDTVSGWFGGQTGLNVVVIDPNYITDYVGEFAYAPTGGDPTGVISIEDSELTFLPNFGPVTRYFLEVTGASSIFSGVTGLSEQIWVNGVRQRWSYDYIRIFPCSMESGSVNELNIPFNFYNNDSGFFNIN